jgi:hypothetical protein
MPAWSINADTMSSAVVQKLVERLGGRQRKA